jgi:hypothetical protein
MEQKYVLKKKNDTFIIQELAETEPGKFAMLFEEKLALNQVTSAITSGGKRELMDLIRTHHFYPPAVFANVLVDGVYSMFLEDAKEVLTIQFNDNEALLNRGTPGDLVVDEKELAEIDKLLEDEDDLSDDFEE